MAPASLCFSKAAAIAWGSSNGIILMYDEHPHHTKSFDLRYEELLRTNMELFIQGMKHGLRAKSRG